MRGFYAISNVTYLSNSIKLNTKDLLRYNENTNSWSYLHTQDVFVPKFIVSLTDPSVIYYQDMSGYRTIGKSTNGGEDVYTQSGYSPTSLVNGVSTHGDIRDLELVSSSNLGEFDVVISGTDGGVLYCEQANTNTNNYNMSWENRNGEGLSITEFWGVGSVKYGKEFVALGAQDNSKFSLIDGVWRNSFGGDGYDAIITHQNEIIMQINFPIQNMSTDYGDSYNASLVNYGGMRAQANTTDHSNGGLVPWDNNLWWKYTKWPTQQVANGDMYVGRYDLAKKDNASTTFNWISNFNTFGVDPYSVLVDIAINEKNDDQIYAVFDQHIFRTLDGGTNWTDLAGGVPLDPWGDPDDGFRTIIIDPSNANNVWIGLDGMGHDDAENEGSFKNRVVRSTNALNPDPALVIWEDYSLGLPAFPVEEIIFEEGSNQRLYVATDVGVYYRDATMNNWECFTHGMPGIAISDIAINYCNRTIYAATHGRGMWSADLLPSDYAVVEDVSPLQTDTWSTDRVLKGSVKIPSGHRLTINNATIGMMADAKIIVEPGAELIVNNSTITSECGGFWSGIEIWADANATNQLGNFPNRQVGKVILENSTISNAEDAISMFKQQPFTKGGGLVVAKNTHFLNNRRAVEMALFENYTVNGKVFDNLSSFKNCVFEIDENYRFDIKYPHTTMVSAFGTRGVKFLGCDFINNSKKDLSLIGVYMYDSKFTIASLGIQDPSTFTHLKSGVSSLKAAYDYNFVVKEAQFTDCKFGVVANGIQNASITQNTFTTTDFFMYTSPVAVFLENANGFIVEENTMSNNVLGLSTPGFVSPFQGDDRGLVVKNAGIGSNTIYKNTFNGLNISNAANGVNYNPNFINRGLTYKCNQMNGSKSKDFSIYGGAYSGIAGAQGATGDPADNMFTNGINGNDGHIANVATNRMDYYHRADAGGYVFEPTQISSSVTTHLDPLNFDDSQHCLSHNDNGLSGLPSALLLPAKVGQWKTSFSSGKTAFDQAKYVYVSTIDGGDTYALLNTVQSTNTQTAWEMRNDLIGSSPLSLEVIFQVMEEDFLSNALLHDVLMENPHAVRDEEVMFQLENKTTPMPAYMINTLLGIYEMQTQKDILEAEMANEMMKMGTAANFLYVHWSSDSLDPDNDSVLVMAQGLNTEIGDWKAVEYLVSKGNADEANALISAMPSKYELANWNLTNYNAKKTYFDYVINVTQNNQLALYQPSPLQVQTLQQMANDSDNYAGRLAQNQVLWAQGKIYWPVIEEEPSFKKAAKNPRQLREVSSLPMLEVYPNPATNYVTLRGVNVNEEMEAVMHIINASGVVVRVKTGQLGPNQEVNIKTQDLASGHYFVLIYQNKQLLQKLAFEVLH